MNLGGSTTAGLANDFGTVLSETPSMRGLTRPTGVLLMLKRFADGIVRRAIVISPLSRSALR
jgi:hypothetical protein